MDGRIFNSKELSWAKTFAYLNAAMLDAVLDEQTHDTFLKFMIFCYMS